MGHGFRFQRTTWLVAALVGVLMGPAAWAVEFTQNTLIAANDPTYDGQDIIVTGCTVTINGYHPFNSLLIRGNGVVTHSANDDAHVNFMDLAVAGSVTIEPGSRLDVSGRGYAPAKGPGAGVSAGYGSGAGHGGHGGRENNGNVGGIPYGEIVQPTDLGSGGGHTSGGAGGGAVRLIVSGTLSVQGSLLAEGAYGSNGGGGSGGSLYLDVTTLAGTGGISANGGRSRTYAGAGAGGRIAVYYGTNSFSGTMTAFTGNSYHLGGAGTIYTKASGSALANLLVDAGGLAGAATLVHSVPANVMITNAASAYAVDALTFAGNLNVVSAGSLIHLANQAPLQLTVQGNVTIDANSAIAADGKGYPAMAGPGAGVSSGYGSGAGHGGHGGRENNGSAGGTPYGSITEPTEFGSGGGHTNGGAGGGAIQMTVAGTLLVNGTLSANGGNASNGGGGSGGSIWIDTSVLAGNGTISANGGVSTTYAGAGAGGRVAIYYDTNNFTGTKGARTGTDYHKGGAGTIHTKASGEPLATLRVDNGGYDGAGTPITSLDADLEIVNRAWAYPQGSLAFQGDVYVGPTSTLTHLANQDPLLLTVQGSVTIDTDGAITADAKGYPAETGPAAGVSSGYGSGAGHGGHGGREHNGAAGGSAYGSITEPSQFGSGGGHNDGGPGGGAIRMTVAGTLEINGRLSVDGANGSHGGGSGGSIWVDAGTLAGSGAISANGGRGTTYAGAGAGGRVAIYYDTDSFTGTKSARTGTEYHKGGAGTIYTKGSGEPLSVLLVDNSAYAGEGTPLGTADGHVTIANGAWVYPSQAPVPIAGNLRVAPGGQLTHLSGQDGLRVAVGGSVTIEAGATVNVDAKGFAPANGPGKGQSSGYGSGAGHGGTGGREHQGAAGGPVYGSLNEPTELGSGGGHSSGGAGGGAIEMIVTGTLTVDGEMSADGGYGSGGGGGSGGSILLDVGTLLGAGTITAGGGNSRTYSGAGGGGRIAVYTCDWQMNPAQITANPGTSYHAGQPGTIFHGSPFITITQQPAAQLVFFGSPVTFHVEANTTHGTLHYQWRKDDVNLENTGHYTGVLTHTLNIDAANYDDNGYYDVWLTDDCGNYISDKARLIVPRPGDLNCDGEEDFGDINPFVLALTNPAGYQQKFPHCRLLQGDCNGDGLVDFGDINPFVRILTGP